MVLKQALIIFYPGKVVLIRQPDTIPVNKNYWLLVTTSRLICKVRGEILSSLTVSVSRDLQNHANSKNKHVLHIIFS